MKPVTRHNDASSIDPMGEALPHEAAALEDAIGRALHAQVESGKAGIAASVLCNGEVIATAENEVNLQSDTSRHAEIVAMARAAEARDSTDLAGCVIVSTLQPCEMCLAAMRFAGVERVIFSARQENVARKYFAFPHLRLTDFQQDGNFIAIGGIGESRVIHLYAEGDE